MPKTPKPLRHFLIVAHPEDGENETHYVMATSMYRAGVAVIKAVKKQVKKDDGETCDVYIDASAELEGPPVSIVTPYGTRNRPVPIIAS